MYKLSFSFTQRVQVVLVLVVITMVTVKGLGSSLFRQGLRTFSVLFDYIGIVVVRQSLAHS